MVNHQTTTSQGPETRPVRGRVHDAGRLAVLRSEAVKHASGFIDPALVRAAETALAGFSSARLEYVTGRSVRSWLHLSNEELALAIAAAKAEEEAR